MSDAAIPDVKKVDTDSPLLPAIAHRWSPRAFLDKPVPADVLKTLFEAARWAASCFNEQPWRYCVAQKSNPDEFEKLLAILVPKNQEWAKAAPVLFLSIARKTFTHNNTPNRHGMHDTGAASATLAIQAAALGLQLHQMAGYDADKARLVLKIPAEFEPCAAGALGYPGPAASLPETFQKGELAPRPRKALAELLFTSTFGEPLQP